MHIVVMSALEAGTQVAHVVNTVNMAQGFAQLGYEVTLICFRNPARRYTLEQLTQIYDLQESMRWVRLPQFSLRGRKINDKWAYTTLALPFLRMLKPDFVFTRNYIAPTVTSRLGIPTVAETHAHADYQAKAFLYMCRSTQRRAFRAVVTISETLKAYYQSLGVPHEKILVLPTGVNVNRFRRPEVLPPNPYCSKNKNIAYAGHLYDYKGIPTILEAAALLPEMNFHLVGGVAGDIEIQKQRVAARGLKNVTFYGLLPQSDLPKYLWHADVLLLPPSAQHPSANWTSPVKLGEYLASGTPIVATAIPALKDWLTENEVVFITPDSGEALAAGIRQVLEHPEETKKRVRAGLLAADKMSYLNRARSILGFCSS